MSRRGQHSYVHWYILKKQSKNVYYLNLTKMIMLGKKYICYCCNSSQRGTKCWLRVLLEPKWSNLLTPVSSRGQCCSTGRGEKKLDITSWSLLLMSFYWFLLSFGWMEKSTDFRGPSSSDYSPQTDLCTLENWYLADFFQSTCRTFVIPHSTSEWTAHVTETELLTCLNEHKSG